MRLAYVLVVISNKGCHCCVGCCWLFPRFCSWFGSVFVASLPVVCYVLLGKKGGFFVTVLAFVADKPHLVGAMVGVAHHKSQPTIVGWQTTANNFPSAMHWGWALQGDPVQIHLCFIMNIGDAQVFGGCLCYWFHFSWSVCSHKENSKNCAKVVDATDDKTMRGKVAAGTPAKLCYLSNTLLISVCLKKEPQYYFCHTRNLFRHWWKGRS